MPSYKLLYGKCGKEPKRVGHTGPWPYTSIEWNVSRTGYSPSATTSLSPSFVFAKIKFWSNKIEELKSISCSPSSSILVCQGPGRLTTVTCSFRLNKLKGEGAAPGPYCCLTPWWLETFISILGSWNSPEIKHRIPEKSLGVYTPRCIQIKLNQNSRSSRLPAPA